MSGLASARTKRRFELTVSSSLTSRSWAHDNGGTSNNSHRCHTCVINGCQFVRSHIPMTSRTTFIVAAAGFALIAIARTQTPSTLLIAGQSTTLGLPGAVNATPSLAVAGRAIAAVWSVSKDGAADVYLAMSSDGGATFSAPRRVNDQQGDA